MYSIFMDKVFLIVVHMLASAGQNVLYIENSGQEIRRRYQTLGYLLSNQHCYMLDTDSVYIYRIFFGNFDRI